MYKYTIVNRNRMIRKLYNLLKCLIVRNFSNNFILIVRKLFGSDNICGNISKAATRGAL